MKPAVQAEGLFASRKRNPYPGSFFFTFFIKPGTLSYKHNCTKMGFRFRASEKSLCSDHVIYFCYDHVTRFAPGASLVPGSYKHGYEENGGPRLFFSVQKLSIIKMALRIRSRYQDCYSIISLSNSLGYETRSSYTASVEHISYGICSLKLTSVTGCFKTID